MYAQTNQAPWEGTASDFFFRRRDKRDAARMETFEEVFGRNNVFASLLHCAEHGGRSAGPDGVSPRDMTPVELGQLAGAISGMILKGHYASSEPKMERIEKPDKPGEYRDLSVPILADKAVAHVLNKTFSPRCEDVFLPSSHGFRPKRGPRSLLRDLNTRVKDGRTFLALDDVRKAFDSIRIDDAMESFAWAMEQTGFPRECQRPRFAAVLRQVLAAGHLKRTTGIPQGCPVSPLIMNLVLHHRLDVPLTSEFTGDGYFRFADNLVYAARNTIRCQQFLDASERLLAEIDLNLKQEHPRIVNLDQRKANVLGFDICRTDQRLKVSLGLRPWSDLEAALREVHYHRYPSRTALSELQGWIEAWGPALDMSDSSTNGSFGQILAVLRRAGISFPKNVLEEIQERMTLSYGRWSSCCS